MAIRQQRSAYLRPQMVMTRAKVQKGAKAQARRPGLDLVENWDEKEHNKSI